MLVHVTVGTLLLLTCNGFSYCSAVML